MELKLDKEPVLLTETVFDGQTEQGIEIEHILPDYCPDVFKLLKCTFTPGTVSYSVSDNKLYIDGVVYVKVLYLSEGSNEISVVDQRYTFSKTVDLTGAVRSPCVRILPAVDFCTARAVSGRKIDIRGAVSLKIKVSGVYETQLLCGAEGMGVQVRTENITVCEDRLSAGSQYIVREDIETGAGGGISAVISSECTACVTDVKVITDKVVVKGEAKVKALYLIRNSSGESSAEAMEASIPLSRIIDLEGVTDAHSTFAELDIMDFSLEIKQSESGESRTLGCDLTVDCRVNSYRETQVSLVNDLYSTEYDTSFTVAPIRAEGKPRPVNYQCGIKTDVQCSDGSIAEIYDASCELVGVTPVSSDNGSQKLNVRTLFRVFGRSEDGVPIIADKNESIEIETDISSDEVFTLSSCTFASGVSYSISGENTAEIRAQLNINGTVCRISTINAVDEITVNEDKPKHKDREYALRLYFADPGESVWEISKRYNTSASAIIAENELDGESQEIKGMILIPIV